MSLTSFIIVTLAFQKFLFHHFISQMTVYSLQMLFHMEDFQMRDESKKLESRNNRKPGETVRKKAPNQ